MNDMEDLFVSELDIVKKERDLLKSLLDELLSKEIFKTVEDFTAWFEDFTMRAGTATDTMERSEMSPTRKLAYRFLELPYVKKMKIAQDLDLLDHEGFKGESGHDMYARFFQRAKKRKLLNRLWFRVEIAHGERFISLNPFAGR